SINSARSVSLNAGTNAVSLPPSGVVSAISGNLSISAATLAVPSDSELLSVDGVVTVSGAASISAGATLTAIAEKGQLMLAGRVDGPGSADLKGTGVFASGAFGGTTPLNVLTL